MTEELKPRQSDKVLADRLEQATAWLSRSHGGGAGRLDFLRATDVDRIVAVLRTVPAQGEPVKDTWLVGGPPDLKAMSGDAEDERVIKLHFRRKATEQDRAWLLEAINAKLVVAPAEGKPSDDYILPCDVKLEPATTITKGCKLSTLMAAFRVREHGFPVIAYTIDPDLIDELQKDGATLAEEKIREAIRIARERQSPAASDVVSPLASAEWRKDYQPDIRSVSQSPDDGRCVMVWFGRPATGQDRQWLTHVLTDRSSQSECIDVEELADWIQESITNFGETCDASDIARGILSSYQVSRK